jgi:hypothetical protein
MKKQATHIVEQLQQIDVIALPPEMFLEEEIDGALEHESVVDGDIAYSGLESEHSEWNKSGKGNRKSASSLQIRRTCRVLI